MFLRNNELVFSLLDLPVLAPFTWKELHINDFNNNILRYLHGESFPSNHFIASVFSNRLSAKLKDGITRGLDVFDVTALNVQISDRKLDFGPELDRKLETGTNGRYEAKGQLAGFVPFDRSGKCSLQLRGTRLLFDTFASNSTDVLMLCHILFRTYNASGRAS